MTLQNAAYWAVLVYVIGKVIVHFVRLLSTRMSAKLIAAQVAKLEAVQESAAMDADLAWAQGDRRVAESFARKHRLGPDQLNQFKGEYIHYLVDVVSRPELEALWKLLVRTGRIQADEHARQTREYTEHIKGHTETLLELGYDTDKLRARMLPTPTEEAA